MNNCGSFIHNNKTKESYCITCKSIKIYDFYSESGQDEVTHSPTYCDYLAGLIYKAKKKLCQTCPFCLNENATLCYFNKKGPYFISCIYCELETGGYDDLDELIDLWNRISLLVSNN